MQQRRKTKMEPQRRIHRHMRPRCANNEHRERQDFWSIFKSAASKHASNSRRCTRLSNPTTHKADTSRQVSSRRRSNINSTQSNSAHGTSTKEKLNSKTHFFCFLAYLPQRLDVVEVVRQQVEAEAEQGGDGPRLSRSAPLAPGCPLHLASTKRQSGARRFGRAGYSSPWRTALEDIDQEKTMKELPNFRGERSQERSGEAEGDGGGTCSLPQNGRSGCLDRDKVVVVK